MKNKSYIAPETTQVIVCQTESVCIVSQGNGTTENYSTHTLDWDE